MSLASLKSSIEGRFLLLVLVLLVAFAVPVSAAAFGAASAIESSPEVPVAAADVLPAQAAGVPLLQNTPPPLLVMLFGALIVAGTVMRRLRKTSVTVRADRRRSGALPDR